MLIKFVLKHLCLLYPVRIELVLDDLLVQDVVAEFVLVNAVNEVFLGDEVDASFCAHTLYCLLAEFAVLDYLFYAEDFILARDVESNYSCRRLLVWHFAADLELFQHGLTARANCVLAKDLSMRHVWLLTAKDFGVVRWKPGYFVTYSFHCLLGDFELTLYDEVNPIN